MRLFKTKKKNRKIRKKQSRRSNTPQKYGKVLLSLLIVGAVVALFVAGPRNIFQYYRSKQDKSRLQREIKELKLKKARLDSELTLLAKDPDYLEKLAREKYNMKKKGEKVYKIIKEE